MMRLMPGRSTNLGAARHLVLTALHLQPQRATRCGYVCDVMGDVECRTAKLRTVCPMECVYHLLCLRKQTNYKQGLFSY